MSSGKLNIWIRDLNCCPKNVWKVELLIKTCAGQYLVNFSPNVIKELKEAYPSFTVELSKRNDEPIILIKHDTSVIKHITLNVPPGCYIVRAWVCWGNLWSDRAMAIVGCGEDTCVNLIVPKEKNCIRDVAIPLAIVAHEMKLPVDRIRIATEVLMRTGQIQREAFIRDLDDLNGELKEAKVKDVAKYVDALDGLKRLVKDIQIKDE